MRTRSRQDSPNRLNHRVRPEPVIGPARGRTRWPGPMMNAAKPIDSRCRAPSTMGCARAQAYPTKGRTARPANRSLLVLRQRIDRNAVVVIIDRGEVEAGVGV